MNVRKSVKDDIKTFDLSNQKGEVAIYRVEEYCKGCGVLGEGEIL